jgi:cytoskeleton-associated protein 5
LLRLLTDGLDTVGESGEGESMIKNLNTTMLRLLEYCDPTSVFVVLIGLLKKYRSYSQLPKLPGLIIKCLLKVIRILDQIINEMNISEVLLAIHDYLCVYPTSSQKNPIQGGEDMGSRIVKTIINELIKLKKEAIWQDYEVIERHPEPDSSIKK